MAYKLIWSSSARLDLKELASYIAESNPKASAHFINSVFNSVERLCKFPESGRIVPEFGESCIREIVRIWHAARGIPQL